MFESSGSGNEVEEGWVGARLKVAGATVVVAAIVTVAFTSLAEGDGGDSAANSAEVPAELAEFCDAMPCTIINNLDLSADVPLTPGASLSKYGKAASECPEAAAAYEAGGLEVDAFLGPCPSAREAADDIAEHPAEGSQ